uniref:PDZ domain-containing protein n=1 Tax=Zooxanthella nutricula TaxID=1333877 RepID=A0A6U8Z2Y1_9DINO|mmetsp:Transcript_15233/g.45120  ORF Transcript_15233/g.45120 Transcript_15233/m.45120 type:complete len:156 (+) Transcript_15233:141-608(+)
MGNVSVCCSPADTSLEQKESHAPKEKGPGVADFPLNAGAPDLGPSAPAAVAGALQKSQDGATKEFMIELQKGELMKIGVDVDTSDGKSFLIEKINEGLVQNWNLNNAEKVMEYDRIVEVNGFDGLSHGGLDKMVQECQRNGVLRMKIARPGGYAP